MEGCRERDNEGVRMGGREGGTGGRTEEISVECLVGYRGVHQHASHTQA